MCPSCWDASHTGCFVQSWCTRGSTKLLLCCRNSVVTPCVLLFLLLLVCMRDNFTGKKLCWLKHWNPSNLKSLSESALKQSSATKILYIFTVHAEILHTQALRSSKGKEKRQKTLYSVHDMSEQFLIRCLWTHSFAPRHYLDKRSHYYIIFFF